MLVLSYIEVTNVALKSSDEVDDDENDEVDNEQKNKNHDLISQMLKSKNKV